MLIGYILSGIFALCCLWGFFGGNAEEIGQSVLTGAQGAIDFCISIAGGVCLWSAVMELMERSGISGAISRIMRPILSKMFPKSSENVEIMDALSENVSANLLGLGNAATPAGIRAAKGMARLSDGGTASDELCLLVVLNTASIQLLPSTIASVRASFGAASAFDIMPAVWISSLLSVFAGLTAAAIFRRIAR